MGYILPGSSVHGILQARILEWVAIPFSRASFLTQGSNRGLLHSKQFIYHLSYQRSLLKLHSQASPVAQFVKKLSASVGDVRDMDSIEESEKVVLKLNIQKTNIMASSPITSWQIDGDTVTDLFSWTPKPLQMVTAALKLKDTYSLEEKP